MKQKKQILLVLFFCLSISCSLAQVNSKKGPEVNKSPVSNPANQEKSSTVLKETPELTPEEIPTKIPTKKPTIKPTKVPSAIPEEPTIRQLADKKQFTVGMYFNLLWFSDPNWKRVVNQQFNHAVIANGFQWSSLEPNRGQLDTSIIDGQIAFAQKNKMTISGHPLLIPTSPDDIPYWILEGDFSKDELSQILKKHISSVMKLYKGKINEWIVVEEAYLPSERMDDIFYEMMGYDYVDLAFETARETDPSAILIYNDLDNHTSDGKATSLTHQMINRLKTKGLVDGVGLEMHLDGSVPYDKQDVINTMKSYGVPVYVTEIDVNMREIPGTREDRFNLEAKIYKDMLDACIESSVCNSFSIWDISDKYHWLQYPTNEYTSSKANPSILDDEFKPKPAFFAIIDSLK